MLQSRSMTPPANSVIASQSALESRDAEIQAADLSRTRSSSSHTHSVFDHAHAYQGYRPVPTQTEHEDKSATSAWFRQEDYLYASDESTSLLLDYDNISIHPCQ